MRASGSEVNCCAGIVVRKEIRRDTGQLDKLELVLTHYLIRFKDLRNVRPSSSSCKSWSDCCTWDLSRTGGCCRKPRSPRCLQSGYSPPHQRPGWPRGSTWRRRDQIGLKGVRRGPTRVTKLGRRQLASSIMLHLKTQRKARNDPMGSATFCEPRTESRTLMMKSVLTLQSSSLTWYSLVWTAENSRNFVHLLSMLEVRITKERSLPHPPYSLPENIIKNENLIEYSNPVIAAKLFLGLLKLQSVLLKQN